MSNQNQNQNPTEATPEATPTLRERIFGIPDRYPKTTAAVGTGLIVHGDKIYNGLKSAFSRGSAEAVQEEAAEGASALFGGGGGGGFKGL